MGTKDKKPKIISRHLKSQMIYSGVKKVQDNFLKEIEKKYSDQIKKEIKDVFEKVNPSKEDLEFFARYLKARANLTAPARRHPGTNEFEFTRLFFCGACNSGITAKEKFKHCKNGRSHRYVYYHCSHSADRYCKQGALREENLLEQLLGLIDKIDIDEIGMREKIEYEINKYRQFSYTVLGKETEFDNKPIEADIKNYAKHVLKNGTRDEKRELLSCLRGRVEIRDKEISLKFVI